MCKRRLFILCLATFPFFLAGEGYAGGRGLRGFDSASPEVRALAPDFTLKDIASKTVSLSEFRGKKSVMLEFGSYTCPVYRGRVKGMERLHERYKEKITIFVIYTIEAHPSGSSSPYADREWVTSKNKRDHILLKQAQDYSGRKKLAGQCIKNLGVTIPVLIDEMDNGVWSAYGRAPNCAFLIDIDGRVVEKQRWFNPQRMENAIISLLKN